ncbi:DUF4082 domain-containing protein [Actinoplanes awajinensis]|nr:DUF4082 domain-containing protein [Actinoplanes awajinensis]
METPPGRDRRAFPALPRITFRNRTIRTGQVLASVATLLAAVLVGSLYHSSAAVASCQPNSIVCENGLPGSPASEWDIYKSGDSTVQGFATDMSVNVGETINFKIRAEHAYTIDIYRLGYYDNAGARKIQSLDGTFPAQNQDVNCISNETTLIYDCGTWGVSANWAVPSSAVSGVYFALLKRTDTGGASHVTFVVRNDASHSDVIFKTSDATWQAYNLYGDANFYNDGPNGRARKLSYNRPFATRSHESGRDFLFSNEYPMIRFLEKNGYDLTYTTDVDSDRRGSLLKNHKTFLSVGHDEYWSGPQRANVEAARDAGTNLAFFSGNEVYWRTRWEPSQDGSNTDYRTLVCYKETWDDSQTDPTGQWTGTYRDPRFTPPATGGAQPENALTGTIFMANHDDLALAVPAAQGKNRFWNNTQAATQGDGDTLTLAPHTVGYESDEDLDNGFRPAGLIRLSTTIGETPQYLQDFGYQVAAGTTEHHMTLYRASSGALVFGAGTIQYAWALDTEHDSEWAIEPVDKRLQQATVNLLADMDAQPATLMSGLSAAAKSTDTVGPTTTITTPDADTSVDNGAVITVKGTAADNGGGVVGGVEVSLDNGGTWHPATGTTSWSYKGVVVGSGTATVKVRATDDTANIGAVADRTIALTGSTTLFGNVTPEHPSSGDNDPVEVGVKVIPKADGRIRGVRFYKGAGNTGTHKGSLWTAGGTQIATGTFEDETASGWQTLLFDDPVPVDADTTYVASYSAPNGNYAGESWAFIYRGHTALPLVAPGSHEAEGNGVFGTVGHFPTRTYNATNYYVDVLFDEGAANPATVTEISPQADAEYVATSSLITATFSKTVDPDKVKFTVKNGTTTIAGAVSYDAAAKKATFTPTATLPAGQEITVSVTATDTTGIKMTSARAWKFTTSPGSGTVSTLFANGDAPATVATDDAQPVSLGVKFSASANGSVVGVRFYKGPGNTGTHTGSLYLATGGAPIATATFADETATGWQYVYFATPVPVTAGTTYVASYYAPFGDYAVTSQYFSSDHVNAPLTGPAGDNGVYAYGSDTFPSGSYKSTNYWVDPLFVAAGGGTTPTDPTPSPSTSTPPSGDVTTLLGDTATPVNAAWDDPNKVELGMTFTSDVAGQVKGVRFYKGSGNTGTHTGSLWPAGGGAALASGTFGTESASGWQTLVFDQPVSINANTPYVVSYLAPNGHYAVTPNGLATALTNAPLKSVANGGRYQYGGGFPGNAAAGNYWVDVLFTAGTASTTPAAPATTPTTSAPATTTAPTTAPTTMAPSPSASASPSASTSATASPSASASSTTDKTVLGDTSIPANTSWDDPNAIELGMKFVSTVDGKVTGVRFFKGAGNTGEHTGSLWAATGGTTPLATGTFADETASGWQTLRFTHPVSITAGTQYVVSYYAPKGNYAVTANGLSAEIANPPLKSVAGGGLYQYGGGFPASAANGNYWVDVLFTPGG